VDSICCLLHSLVPGGSTWQWIRLLERHAARGGRATIVAEPGPLAERARTGGIDVVTTGWTDPVRGAGIWPLVAEHELAIVQWEAGVMDAFPRALEECERVALAVHMTPQAMTRWFVPPTPMRARRMIQLAAADPRAVVLVRGEAHRRKVAATYAVPEDSLRILPVAVPLASLPYDPAGDQPEEVLALTRLGPEKTALAKLAVALVRERLGAGRPCRLTIAGDGPWRPQAIALCERSLAPGSWRIEGPPADPIARLAAADLVVAQGTTTLEAAALGRRVVVARSYGARGASGVVLTPPCYDQAARNPFGDPSVTEDTAYLWEELLAIDATDLAALRKLVERHNSLDAAQAALDGAFQHR